MVEKKCTKKAATTKKTAEKKATVKKTVEKKAVENQTAEQQVVAEKPVFAIDAINVGWHAGDVYEALAQAQKALSIEELANNAKLSEPEVLLGMGWLLKEGKIKEDNGLVILA